MALALVAAMGTVNALGGSTIGNGSVTVPLSLIGGESRFVVIGPGRQ